MTLINSCWPNSFSHLIILLSTITTISTNHLYQDVQRETTNSLTAPLVSKKTLTEAAVGDQRGYDHRRIDNKRYDNLFDFKTDVNNLLFHSHDSLTRKRRNVINDVNDTGTNNLILNLSNANFTNLNILNVNISTSNVIALNLSNNLLSTLNVSNFYNLTSLDLSNNRFSEFKVNGHEHLKALDLSSNLLKNFSCIKCECLETLNLSRNFITTIDGESFDNLINLNFLDLSSNELSVIDPNLFQNKSNLSDVILSCNRISVINKDMFFQLPCLRRLDLSHNDISDVVNDAFSDLTSLQILDLSFNRIHIASLQTIQNIAQLARLSIAGNVMLKNALRAFAVTWSIMELDYSHVGLCQVPDSLAQSVRILNLYGNFLNVSISSLFLNIFMCICVCLSFCLSQYLHDLSIGLFTCKKITKGFFFLFFLNFRKYISCTILNWILFLLSYFLSFFLCEFENYFCRKNSLERKQFSLLVLTFPLLCFN